MSSSKQCQYCDKLFSRSFNLRSHLENGSFKINHKLDYGSSSTEEEELSDVDSYEDVSMESESSESDVSSQSEYDSDEEADLSWCWQVLVDDAADQHETERLKIIQHLVSEGETEASAI